MGEIGLTPTEKLRWEHASDQTETVVLSRLKEVFDNDCFAGLFKLAADKCEPVSSSTLRYWRELAEWYLTQLCHIPETQKNISIEMPSSADCTTWLLTAPPMSSGEYLSENILRDIWMKLDQSVYTTIASCVDVHRDRSGKRVAAATKPNCVGVQLP